MIADEEILRTAVDACEAYTVRALITKTWKQFKAEWAYEQALDTAGHA